MLSPETASGIKSFFSEKTAGGPHWDIIAFAVLGSLLIEEGLFHSLAVMFLLCSTGADLICLALACGWSSFGTDNGEGGDFRACKTYGPVCG